MSRILPVVVTLLFACASGCGAEHSLGPAPAGTLAVGEALDALDVLADDDRPYRHVMPKDVPVTVIWFWSTMCRCVRECEPRIRRLREMHPPETLRFLAIDANPDDTLEEIRALRMKLGTSYPVLRDAGGTTARRLGVTASASVAVLDAEGRVRYRGAIDDSLYEPTVSYVERAVEAVLAGREPEPSEVPSYGCLYPVAEDGR